MRRAVLHPAAEEELEASTLYYESCSEGLGGSFLDDYEATLAVIAEAPGRWRKIRHDNRKRNFDRFPYAIVYSYDPQTIYVKAVMHLHRRPFYWKFRA